MKKKLPITDIKLNPDNPRFIKDEKYKALVNSLQEFPEMADVREVVVNSDYMILGGNMRYRAMKEAGWKEIPVRVVDWSEEKQREFIIKDNSNFGEWDWDVMANKWDSEPLDEWGVDLPTNWNTGKIEEDEPPELSDEPAISKLGEVYKLGRHRLMCGDSTKVEDVERLMDGQKADMVFTDPPYNIDYQGGMNTHGQNKREGILNDEMSDAQFYEFLLEASKRLIENTNGAIYICMSSKELPNLKSAFERAGGHWQSFIIWVKNTFTLSRSDYQNQYEPILYGWPKDYTNHYFIDDRTQGNIMYQLSTFYDDKKDVTKIKVGNQNIEIKGKSEGVVVKSRVKKDIWEYPKPTNSKEHPTMKPLVLVGEAIKNSSLSDNIILDTFGGSGSTLIAAEQLDRVCYMMELDPKYCDVIRKRYHKFTTGSEDGWIQSTSKI
jgi:DNA modification methylase